MKETINFFTGFWLNIVSCQQQAMQTFVPSYSLHYSLGG
jgi:hypothetical protein